MPRSHSQAIKDLILLKTDIAELKTEVVWLKRIIIGAAGLGFLEKILTWLR